VLLLTLHHGDLSWVYKDIASWIGRLGQCEVEQPIGGTEILVVKEDSEHESSLLTGCDGEGRGVDFVGGLRRGVDYLSIHSPEAHAGEEDD
jgi:hypothetical protein